MRMNYQLQPPRILVMGSPGSGKTHSLATLIEAGLEVFVAVTEPDGVSSLIDAVERHELPMDKLHWNYNPPAAQGWKSLKALTDKIGHSTFEQLQNDKSGIGKEETRVPAVDLITLFSNFHCDRTNRDYGPIDKFNSNCAVVLDSLSGLNLIAWMLAVGHKSNPHQGEWGTAMNYIEQMMLKLTSDLRCFFVATAHLEREVNELTGATQTTVSTLGKKLAPKLTRFFSEVVMAKRITDGTSAKFVWSTIEPQADLKNRSLPVNNAIPQTYVPIVQSYIRRLKSAGLEQATDAPLPLDPPAPPKPLPASLTSTATTAKETRK